MSASPLTSQQRSAIAGRLTLWNSPDEALRPEPVTTDGFIPTASGRVKPSDVDATGHSTFGAIVHRFSNASGQLGAAVGMDTGFMQQERRGFSTFELTLLMSDGLRLDAPLLVETGIGHLGNSSLRMIHRMIDPRNGAEVARVSQFGVNLDLDARRPRRMAPRYTPPGCSAGRAGGVRPRAVRASITGPASERSALVFGSNLLT